MDYTKIDENLTHNITLIRKKTGLNQENFFDSAGIGEYKTNINSGPGKANYISKLESPDSGSFPAVLLPAYAKIGKCTIDDLFKGPGETGSFSGPDSVEEAISTISSSAYDTCCILYQFYLAAAFRIVNDEEGTVYIQIADRGNVPGKITPEGERLSFYIQRPGNRISIENLGDKASLINKFLNTLKDVYENPDLQKYLKDYGPSIIAGELQKVKEEEKIL